MTFKWNVPFKGHLGQFMQVFKLVSALNISGNSIKYQSRPPIATNASTSIAATTVSTPATTVSIPGYTARVSVSSATITFSVVDSTSIGWYHQVDDRHDGSSHRCHCYCSATAATCPATTTTITNLNATTSLSHHRLYPTSLPPSPQI